MLYNAFNRTDQLALSKRLPLKFAGNYANAIPSQIGARKTWSPVDMPEMHHGFQEQTGLEPWSAANVLHWSHKAKTLAATVLDTCQQQWPGLSPSAAPLSFGMPNVSALPQMPGGWQLPFLQRSQQTEPASCNEKLQGRAGPAQQAGESKQAKADKLKKEQEREEAALRLLRQQVLLPVSLHADHPLLTAERVSTSPKIHMR